MVRDFTEETKARLQEQIAEIERKQWNPLSDAIGDLFLHAGSVVGIVDSESWFMSLKTYQKLVLDRDDIELGKLDQIFEDVAQVDSDYAEELETSVSAQKLYAQKLKKLAESVGSAEGFSDAQSLNAELKKLNKEIETAHGKTVEVYDKNLEYMENKLFWDSGKELIGDVLSFGGNVIGFAGGLLTMNPGVVADKFWGTINSFFATAEDFNAAGMAVLSKTLDLADGDSERCLEARKDYVEWGNEGKNRECLADTLNGEVSEKEIDDSTVIGKINKTIDTGIKRAGQAAGVVDVALFVYGVWKNVNDIAEGIVEGVEGIGGIVKGTKENAEDIGKVKEVAKGTKENSAFTKYIKNPVEGLAETFGFTITMDPDDGISLSKISEKKPDKLLEGYSLKKYQKFEKLKSYYSNLENLYKVGESIYDDGAEKGLVKKFVKGTKIGGFISDIEKAAEKLEPVYEKVDEFVDGLRSDEEEE